MFSKDKPRGQKFSDYREVWKWSSNTSNYSSSFKRVLNITLHIFVSAWASVDRGIFGNKTLKLRTFWPQSCSLSGRISKAGLEAVTYMQHAASPVPFSCLAVGAHSKMETETESSLDQPTEENMQCSKMSPQSSSCTTTGSRPVLMH